MTDNVFLEIVPLRFTKDDFTLHKLPIPFCKNDDAFKMIFFTEEDYFKYLKYLEDEFNLFLSQYWIVKSKGLIEKNRFIIKVITSLKTEYSKKHNYSY